MQYARIKILVGVLRLGEIGLSATYVGNDYVAETRRGIVLLKANILFAGMDPAKDK